MMQPAPPPRSWTTPVLTLLLLVLVIASFATLRLDLAAFFTPEAVGTTLEFLEGFAPPETAMPFLLKTLNAALETLSMSALGTLLAVIAGLVLALPASGRWGGAARALVRVVLNVLKDRGMCEELPGPAFRATGPTSGTAMRVKAARKGGRLTAVEASLAFEAGAGVGPQGPGAPASTAA